MWCDVRAIADQLRQKGIVAKIEVANERKKDKGRFWVSFAPEAPMEFILTDGTYSKHPDQRKPGNIEYRVSGDATYVLIIVRHDGRWAIKYAYFVHRWRLNTNKLVPEMRNFNNYAKLPHEDLEQFVKTITGKA